MHLNYHLSLQEKTKLEDRLQSLQRTMKNPYGTVRDPAKTTQGWRKSLPFQLAFLIQQKCSGVMEHLGYRSISSVEELHNLNKRLW